MGGVIFMLAAAAVGYSDHRASTRQLVQLTEENNVALATALTNILQSEWPNVLAPDERDTRYDEVAGADQVIRRVTSRTRVLRVTVYDPAGRVAYSNDPRRIGMSKIPDERFAAALAGAVASTHGRVDEIRAGDGLLLDRTVVSSSIPLRSAEGFGHLGVFQIDTDVTDLEAKVVSDSLRSAGIIAAGFASIYLLLLATVAAGSRLVARKHAETVELAAAAARAEASNKGKSEFLVNMSHELRTPLNAILGFSDVIRNEVYGPVSPPVYKDYAAHIHGAGSHLLGIINDILDLLKTNAGKMQISAAEIDLGELVDETVALMQQSAAAARVRLDSIGARSLPVGSADARKLKQVLINLLDNALKFTPAGGSVTLEARHDPAACVVEFIVTDTGIGIAEADIPTCLAPFGQVDGSLARKYEGTGLGLPLSNQFVQLMGGSLSIQSEVGKGTRVFVRLPVYAREHTAPRMAA